MILKESEILRKTVVLGWFSTMQVAIYTRGGGTPIWNRRGCSSEILNLTPKGDHLGVAKANFDP